MHVFDYFISQFVTWVRYIRMVVTPSIVFEVLHMLRVAHLDYPGCECLRKVSKEELSSLFCEIPSSWGDRQNTSCSAFVIEGLTIDFPSHFILSLIDVYKDTVTRDKLIFPSVIMRLLCHFSVSYPESPHFSYMCVIDATTVK